MSFDVKTKLKLFDSLVSPIFLYAEYISTREPNPLTMLYTEIWVAILSLL